MDTTLFTTLLFIHILAGTLTLFTAAISIISKIADMTHNWHVYAGRYFFVGMLGIFVTALGMSVIRLNPPMLFISIFSFYFAWIGRRYAVNRKGIPSQIDKIVIPVMLAVFVGMTLYGLYATYGLGESFGIVIIVFGVIGVLNAWQDLQHSRSGGIKGKTRIAEHLARMLGGTIAAVSAFVVVNVEFEPAFIVWLAPTFLLTPIIFIWARKINGGTTRKGMPVES